MASKWGVGGLEPRRLEPPSYEMGKATGRTGCEGQGQELSFGHIPSVDS